MEICERAARLLICHVFYRERRLRPRFWKTTGCDGYISAEISKETAGVGSEPVGWWHVSVLREGHSDKQIRTRQCPRGMSKAYVAWIFYFRWLNLIYDYNIAIVIKIFIFINMSLRDILYILINFINYKVNNYISFW
jgi:hypothetical protein